MRRQATIAAAFLLLGCAADSPPVQPVADQVQQNQAPACGRRAEIVAELANRFHEVPAGLGLSNTGAIFEILAVPDGSTWTALMSMANGVSCIVATGEGWTTSLTKQGRQS